MGGIYFFQQAGFGSRQGKHWTSGKVPLGIKLEFFLWHKAVLNKMDYTESDRCLKGPRLMRPSRDKVSICSVSMPVYSILYHSKLTDLASGSASVIMCMTSGSGFNLLDFCVHLCKLYTWKRLIYLSEHPTIQSPCPWPLCFTLIIIKTWNKEYR